MTQPPKFRNRKVTVDGLSFDSVKESRRWADLCLLQRAGQISDLSRQVRLPLKVNGQTIGHIVPDFSYTANGQIVYEDVKSVATITPMFKWKAKHFLAQYGIPITVHL